MYNRCDYTDNCKSYHLKDCWAKVTLVHSEYSRICKARDNRISHGDKCLFANTSCLYPVNLYKTRETLHRHYKIMFPIPIYRPLRIGALLLRGLPFADESRGIAAHDGAGRNILVHAGVGADDDIFANHRAHANECAGTYPRALFERYACRDQSLLGRVGAERVVARRAEVAVLAHGGALAEAH